MVVGQIKFFGLFSRTFELYFLFGIFVWDVVFLFKFTPFFLLSFRLENEG